MCLDISTRPSVKCTVLSGERLVIFRLFWFSMDIAYMHCTTGGELTKNQNIDLNSKENDNFFPEKVPNNFES